MNYKIVELSNCHIVELSHCRIDKLKFESEIDFIVLAFV
jgi:hypothetical protein